MPASIANAVDVDVVFRQRLENSVEWLVRSLSREAKLAAVGSADVPELVLSLARNTPSTDPAERDAAEQLARTAEFKRDLVRRAGGALTTEQVRMLLGYRSAQAVHKALASGRLLAVDDNGSKLFPAFQFDGSSILPGMAEVLAAARGASPWALLQFMVEGDEGLGPDRPMDLIGGGRDALARAVRFARTLTD